LVSDEVREFVKANADVSVFVIQVLLFWYR
jgi:hypothetical protein